MALNKDTYQLSSVPIKERPAVLWSVYSSGSQLWTKAEEIEKSETTSKVGGSANGAQAGDNLSSSTSATTNRSSNKFIKNTSKHNA